MEDGEANTRIRLRKLFDLLSDQVDPGPWWPAETRFEIVVGAVLVQHTAWTSVEPVLAELSSLRMLDPAAVCCAPLPELARLLRPCGYSATKASYLRGVSEWFAKRDDEAKLLPTDRLRAELLSLRGIGPETADVLLLYAYERPVFIFDAYARRLLEAAGHGTHRSYERAKSAVDPAVADAAFTASELGAFHGLIVEAGKRARGLGGWQNCFHLLMSGDFASPRDV